MHVHSEKVTTQQDKQFIILEGESMRMTIITYEDGGDVIESTTFKMYANNFVARGITFKVIAQHQYLLIV